MKYNPEIHGQLEDIFTSYLNDAGLELNNPKPMNENIQLEQPLTLQQRVARCLHGSLALKAHEQGIETIEEFEDYSINEPFEDDLTDSTHTLMEEEYLPPKTETVDEQTQAQETVETTAETTTETTEEQSATT